METTLSKKYPTGRQPSSLNSLANGRVRSVPTQGSQRKRVHSFAAHHGAFDDSHDSRSVLSLFSARRAIYRSLGREFAGGDFSEVRFATLATLYALEPQPATPDKLALHADVSRTRMKEAIDDLECRGLVAWSDSIEDRQTPVHLTDLGCKFTGIAVHRFLQVASEAAGAPSQSDASAVAKGSRIRGGYAA